jgi:hypothetical protein
VLRIDRAITIASTASVLGYHERDVAGRGGTLQQSVERLVRDGLIATQLAPH